MMSWIGLSALFPNAGRVLAQRPWLDRATVARITLAAALAAWGL